MAAKLTPPALNETFSDLQRYGATPTALILPDDITIEECVELGERLGKLQSASMFWIGDLLVHSYGHFGESASQIEDATGYARSTLHTAKYVCEHVKPEIRNSLSFSHHQAVVAVDEELQKHWLAEALKLSLPVDGVKAAIKDLQRMAGVANRTTGPRAKDPEKRAAQEARDAAKEAPPPTARETAALARAASKVAKANGTALGASEAAGEPSSNGRGDSAAIVARQLGLLLENVQSLRQAAADLDDQMVEVENQLAAGKLEFALMAGLLKQIRVFDTIKHLLLESASQISSEALGLNAE